jgi:hypothetical protein
VFIGKRGHAMKVLTSPSPASIASSRAGGGERFAEVTGRAACILSRTNAPSRSLPQPHNRWVDPT